MVPMNFNDHVDLKSVRCLADKWQTSRVPCHQIDKNELAINPSSPKQPSHKIIHQTRVIPSQRIPNILPKTHQNHINRAKHSSGTESPPPPEPFNTKSLNPARHTSIFHHRTRSVSSKSKNVSRRESKRSSLGHALDTRARQIARCTGRYSTYTKPEIGATLATGYLY